MKIQAFCTAQSPPHLPFPNQALDRSDAAMLSELDALMDDLFGDGSEMESQRYALIRHIQRVSRIVTFEIDEARLPEAASWLSAALAVARWPGGSLRDPQGRALYRASGAADEDAALPISSQAQARKSSNERRLAAQGVIVPGHLPTVVDELQLLLRAPDEVARRALALFLVAVRAESVGEGDPIPLADLQERQPLGWEALSPLEQEFFQEDDPPTELTIAMSWRYEALQLLLWALGHCELPPATEIADVSGLVGFLVEADETQLVNEAALRPPNVLLDALDLHYRSHWAVRQAGMAGEQPPADLQPGVVLERHYALNWLTRFEEAPWDEVDTPT